MVSLGPDTCRASVSTPSGWRCLCSAFVFVLLSRSGSGSGWMKCERGRECWGGRFRRGSGGEEGPGRRVERRSPKSSGQGPRTAAPPGRGLHPEVVSGHCMPRAPAAQAGESQAQDGRCTMSPFEDEENKAQKGERNFLTFVKTKQHSWGQTRGPLREASLHTQEARGWARVGGL